MWTDKDWKSRAINESIWHWIRDVYIPMLTGKIAYTSKCEYHVIWADSECPLPLGQQQCSLCKLYFTRTVNNECPDCPLTFYLNDNCQYEESSYVRFMNNPTKRNALKMIKSLIKARNFLLKEK